MTDTFSTSPEMAARGCRLAVLPVGAVEQHGPHLPLATDWLLAQAMARRLAESRNAYLLPALAIASSIEHAQGAGTVYLRMETLALVIRDTAASLRGGGFTRLVLANFHGGNWVLKPTVRQLNRDWPDFRVILIGPDLPAALNAEIFQHPAGDVHAGEFETSLMLHLYPEHVRALPKGGPAAFPPQGDLDYFDVTELTPAGYWGWPEAASADKGRRAWEGMVAAALAQMSRLE